jgi:hypothetical protein
MTLKTRCCIVTNGVQTSKDQSLRKKVTKTSSIVILENIIVIYHHAYIFAKKMILPVLQAAEHYFSSKAK